MDVTSVNCTDPSFGRWSLIHTYDLVCWTVGPTMKYLVVKRQFNVVGISQTLINQYLKKAKPRDWNHASDD